MFSYQAKKGLKQHLYKPPKQPTIQQPKSVTQQLPTTKGTSTLLGDSLPRVWKKSDLSTDQTGKFSRNGSDSGSLPDMKPCGYFELFWDNDLFERIQTFSKLYATQQDPRSSFHISVDELKAMVGICLMSGYNILPRRRLYWSTESDLCNE